MNEPYGSRVEQALERALEEAEADIAAGRVVKAELVHRWLKSLGTDDELPMPEPEG